MCDFVHLHNHSEYSLLDGGSTVKSLIERTVEIGQPALAITDHGNMIGAVEFHREAKKAGILPVIGCELYATRYGTSMADKDVSNRKPRHLLAIAQSREGYQNLIKLISAANIDGFYYKPRVDFDILSRYNSGIITTTGCMAAEIPQLIMDGKDDDYIRHIMSNYVDIFGQDRYFVELQEHPGIPELLSINKKLIELSKYFGLKIIVTNDSHYARKEDAIPHDVLLCVQTKSFVGSPDRMKFSDEDYYLKNNEEMMTMFESYPDFDKSWLTNTIEIAESCQFDIEEHTEHLPSIEIPPIYKDYDDMLEALVFQKIDNFYTNVNAAINIDIAKQRAREELKVIKETGYSVYYLIIYDLLKYAHDNDIFFNCRGSGAGSIVSYILGLSFIDPLEYDLLMERFIAADVVHNFENLGL